MLALLVPLSRSLHLHSEKILFCKNCHKIDYQQLFPEILTLLTLVAVAVAGTLIIGD